MANSTRPLLLPLPVVLVPLIAFVLLPLGGDSLPSRRLLALGLELMLGLPTLFLCTKTQLLERLGLKLPSKFSWPLIGSILLLPVAFHLFSALVGTVLPPPTEYADSLQSLLFTPGPLLWVSWGTLVIVAPVFEELFFRGVLLDYFEHSHLKKALLLQALVFALLHSSLELLPQLFLLGLALGWLRKQSASLWPGIIAHAIINLSALLMLLS
jgi:uncharacterized protein